MLMGCFRERNLAACRFFRSARILTECSNIDVCCSHILQRLDRMASCIYVTLTAIILVIFGKLELPQMQTEIT